MQFLIANGAMQTTAAFVKVATGTTIKSMLQVLPLVPMRIVEWGWSGDASAAATPGQVELIDTGSVAATVTANVAADLTQYDAEALLFNANATFFTLSTTGTGFTASAEGTITAVRNLAGPQQIASTNQFIEQFPLGYRPVVPGTASNKIMRIRNTFGTSVNAYCYVIVEV
jgi:hypothetical protein